MDVWQFYMNRWLFPVMLTGLFFCIHVSRKPLAEWIGKIKSKKDRLMLGYLLEGLDVKLGDWRKTILPPAALAIGLDFLVSWIYQMPLHASGEALWFALLTGGFLNPIAEEFLVRGIGLGAFALLAERTSKKWKEGEAAKYSIWLFGMLFISYAFTIGHNNTTAYQFAGRFAKSMLFGLLYLLSGRNLLPPIIAHAASNLFLILNDEASCA